MNSRRKGHNYERDIVKFYRQAGYSDACTSRNCAPQEDHKGIDIVGVEGIAPQCKCYKTYSGSKMINTLAGMDTTDIKALHVKITGRGEIVVLTLEDWQKMVELPPPPRWTMGYNAGGLPGDGPGIRKMDR